MCGSDYCPDDTGFRQDAEAKVGAATKGINPKIKVGADTAAAGADIDKLKARLSDFARKVYDAGVGVTGDKEAALRLAKMALKLDDLGRKIADPKVTVSGFAKAEVELLALDAGFDKLGRKTAEVSKGLKLASPAWSQFIAAGVALGPALLPVLGAATGAVVGLSGVIAGAGSALGLFAVAGKANLTAMASDLKKVQAANLTANVALQTSASQRTKSQDAAIAKARQLTAAFTKTYGPEANAVTKLQSAWKVFVAQPIVTSTLARGMGLLTHALPDLIPLLKLGGQAVTRFLNTVGMWQASGGLKSLVAWLVSVGRPALAGLDKDMHSLGAAAAAVGPGFAKLSNLVGGGLTSLVTKFGAFAAARGPAAMTSLFAAIQRDGPKVWALLRNLAAVVPNLVRGLDPLAPVSLALATSLAAIIAHVPPGVITAIAIGFVAWAAGAKALMAANALGNAWSAVAKFAGATVTAEGAIVAATGATEAMTTAEILSAAATRALALAMDALPFVAVAAFAALVIGLAVAARNQKDSTQKLIDTQTRQDKATGFNIAGYQKLAASLGSSKLRTDAFNTSLEDQGSAGRFATGQMQEYATRTSELSVAQQHAQQAAENLTGRLNTLQAEYGLTRAAAEAVAVKAGVTAAKFGASGDAGLKAYGQVVTYAAGLSQAQIASLNAAAATSNFSNALNTLDGGLLSSQSDLIAWRQAQQAATTAIAASSTGLKGNSAAALAAKQAVLGSTQAAISLAQHEATLAGGVGKASSTIRDQIAWLQKHGDKSAFARQEIDALRLALAKLKSKSVTLSVNGFGKYSVSGPGGIGTLLPGGGGHRLHAAAGLLVTGGIPGVDSVPILAQRDELVIPVPIVKSGAVDHLKGMIPGFAAGGVVGSYAGAVSGQGPWLSRNVAATTVQLENAVAAGTFKAMKAAQAASGGSFGAAGPGGGAPSANAALARRMFPGENFSAWNYVAMRESGWNQFARNPSSGAYGIAQALPPTKYPFAGQAAGGSNPAAQISWMEGYMRSRYGGAAGAAAHEAAFNWYGTGAWSVPQTGAAMVHQGEMVIAAELAGAVRQVVSGGRRGPAGGPGSGGKAMQSAGASLAGFYSQGGGTVAGNLAEMKLFLKDIAKYFAGASAKWRDAEVMRQTARLDKVVGRLDAVKSAIATAQALQASTLQGLSGYGDLSTMTTGQGVSILSQKQSSLANLKTFASVLAKLAAAHIPASLMQQVVALGPDQGTLFGQEILGGGPALMKALAGTEKAIGAAELGISRGVASDVTTGKYKPGADFLSSLISQRKGLTTLFRDLGKELGREAAKWFGVPQPKPKPKPHRRRPKRTHMAGGGVIGEQIWGVGASGDEYEFGEHGVPETVTPGLAGRRGGDTIYNVHVSVPPNASLAEVGRVTVKAIQAYEAGNTDRWRR